MRSITPIHCVFFFFFTHKTFFVQKQYHSTLHHFLSSWGGCGGAKGVPVWPSLHSSARYFKMGTVWFSCDCEHKLTCAQSMSIRTGNITWIQSTLSSDKRGATASHRQITLGNLHTTQSHVCRGGCVFCKEVSLWIKDKNVCAWGGVRRCSDTCVHDYTDIHFLKKV